ncbi:MAG: GNAT family N-acetyltransferase [Elusimicrobia bacterium]|nr:GNAT family N-acetyltransferase [Elusimicrobiota bacterium]
MNIRKLFKEDVESLAEIEAQYPDYPAWRVKGLKAEFENKHSITLGAEYESNCEDGKKSIKGFINFWILPPSIQLNAIIVSRDSLRNKIASGLMSKMLEYAKKNSCSEIDLEVNVKNKAAVSFYNKMGFKKVGQREKFYNGKDDAILMKLQIAR